MNYKEKELNNIIFFKEFKYFLSSENFNNKNNSNENINYIYPSDVNVDKKYVLKEFFSLLKKDIINEIGHKYIKNKNIKWIFGIPSSWDQRQRQIIKNITIEAEMYNINFIYESEASALSMYYDKFIPNNLKQKNKIFMLIDAGGLTADITIYKIIDNYGTMKEMITTQSYYLGILNMVDKIIKILEEILGKNTINTIKKIKPGEWVKTLNDINKAIENAYAIEGPEIFEINAKFGQKDNYKDINYKGKNYRIKYDIFNIYIPTEIIGKIIFDNLNLIKEKIDKILQDLKIKKINLDSIIITGGFSKNKIFQKEIEQYFNNKNINNLKIDYLYSYNNVISKGSVIYGIHSQQIKTRISPVTIGIENESSIEILVKKDDEIKNCLLTKIIRPNNREQEYIKINIYISEKNNFEKFEENDIKGIVLLKLDKKNKGNIILNINYNIIISFFAVYENGDEINGNLELYYYR